MLLAGKDTYLRALEPRDLDLLYEWENNTAVWPVSGTLAPFSKHALSDYINNQQDIYTSRQLRLVIVTRKDDRPLGFIDLFEFDPHHSRAGVGILIGDQEERQKGYASDALEILIRYAFEVLGLHQLHCSVATGNEKSLKLFEGKRFRLCGTRKGWVRSRNGWQDEYFLQLLNEASV